MRTHDFTYGLLVHEKGKEAEYCAFWHGFIIGKHAACILIIHMLFECSQACRVRVQSAVNHKSAIVFEYQVCANNGGGDN